MIKALQSYGFPVRLVEIMDSVSVNKFRDNLKALVDRVVTDHSPLKVTRRAGEDFMVVSAEDWEREQETLQVLQNGDLMRQIAASLASHERGTGYRPSEDQLDEITGLRR
jgi:antitoxin YefM